MAIRKEGIFVSYVYVPGQHHADATISIVPVTLYELMWEYIACAESA